MGVRAVRFDPRPEIARGRPGQCDACGTFRPDGQPVTTHFTGCPRGSDGRQLGAVGQGLAYMHAERAPYVERASTQPAPRKGKRIVTGPTIPENVSLQRGAWRRR